MRKELPKIIIIFLIMVGVVLLGLKFIFLGPAPKSKAGGETISYVFDPSSVSQASGEFATSVKIKPSVDMTIRGYQFEIIFDKSKTQFKNIQYKIGAVSAGVGDDDSKISVINQDGKIKVVGEIQSATGQVILTSQNTEVVAVTFTANSSQSSSIATGDVDAKFFMIKADYSLFEVPSAGQASFSINTGGPTLTPTSPPPTATPGGPTLTPTPVRPKLCQSATISKTTLGPDESLTITSTANTSDILRFTYVFYNLDNLYEPNNPKPISFVPNIPYSRSGVDYPPGTASTNSITVTYDELNKPDLNWDSKKPKKIQVNAYFTNSASEVSLAEPNCVVMFNITLTPTGGPGNTTLNIKLKFQGITGSLADAYKTMPVKITLKTRDKIVTTESASFNVDVNGIWSGTTNVDLPSGTGSVYSIFIKGPMHIQKKICTNIPIETSPGTYSCGIGTISLSEGENNLDFSGIMMMAGDLPLPQTGGQDGIADAADIGYIINNLGKVDADVVSIGDLNRNGGIDAADFSIEQYALSLHPDEQ